MKIDSATETRESWIPLEKALGQAQCKDFMWMGSTGTVQQYSTSILAATCLSTPSVELSTTIITGQLVGSPP